MTDESERRATEPLPDAWYRTFFERSLDLLCIANTDGYFEALNPAFSDVLGWTLDELTSVPFLHYVHPDDLEDTLAEVARLAEGVPTVSFENRYRTKDGEWRWLNWNSGPDPVSGKLFAVARDVTAARAAADELERTRAIAEAANRAKSSFLANMSHELRTPLNAIIGYSEMLVEDARDGDDATLVQDLGRIHKAGLHLLDLINQVLDLSKVEAGKVELYYEQANLGEIIDGVVGTIRPLIEASGNRLEVAVDDGGGPITTDITRLRQIVLNLLSNANKFSEKATIRLTARRFVDDEGTDLFELDVIDEGIGMDAEEQARVFEPFAQADASTTRRFGGTGLGLAICRHFVELLGGDIALESTPGVGTSVALILPAARSVEEPPEYATSRSFAPVLAPDAPHVVVADDDPAARSLVRRQLRRAGYRVSTASDGEEALRLVREEKPDLVTLDIMMPGRDGWEVIERLRADPKTADLPVLMLSVLRERRLALVVGADDYLVKPVPKEVLVSTVERLIEGTPLVLVVDDDEDARQLTGRRLAASGLDVAYACDGKEALRALEADHPGAIVLDLMMPGMDGFELLEALQDDPNLASIPVVVQTSKMITREDRRRFTAQVGEVLAKASTRGRTVIEAVAAALGDSAPRGR